MLENGRSVYGVGPAKQVESSHCKSTAGLHAPRFPRTLPLFTQGSAMSILTPVPLPHHFVYATAHRFLRPILGPKAPAVADLIIFEMSRRDAISIAEEYLEHHGYPTLRTCRRKLSALRAAAKGRPVRLPVFVPRQLRRPIAQGDPSRN